MPTDKQRIYLTLHDEQSLAILACEASSAPIHEALTAYARAIEEATASVSQALSRSDWNYLADCLNGCWHVQELSGISARGTLRAEAEDAHRLNDLGRKWFASGVEDVGVKNEGELVAERVQALLLTLAGLSEIEAQAILIAVRHFWRHPEIDHNREEWWTVRHRLA